MNGCSAMRTYFNSSRPLVHSSFEIVPISFAFNNHANNNGRGPSIGIFASVHNLSIPSAPITLSWSGSAYSLKSSSGRFTSSFTSIGALDVLVGTPFTLLWPARLSLSSSSLYRRERERCLRAWGRGFVYVRLWVDKDGFVGHGVVAWLRCSNML